MSMNKGGIGKRLTVRAIAALAVILLFGNTLLVQAVTYIYSRASAPGILIVWPQNHYAGVDQYGVGAQLSIYQIADAQIDATNRKLNYTLTADFAKFRIDFDQVRQDGINTELSQKMIDFIRKNGLTGRVLMTDDMGRGVFYNLQAGLYLVVQTGASADYAAKYKDIAPFYVNVPILDVDGMWQQAVTVCPKLETLEPPAADPPKPPKPDHSTQTPTDDTSNELRPIDPETGWPIDPATGWPIDPATGWPINPETGLPTDPVTGYPIDPVTGYPIDPETGMPIDPVTGYLIDPETGWPIDPATGWPINPETGLPTNPETGETADLAARLAIISSNLLKLVKSWAEDFVRKLMNGGWLPQTGLQIIPIILLAGLGIVLLGIGAWQVFRTDASAGRRKGKNRKRTFDADEESQDGAEDEAKDEPEDKC